MCPQRRKLVKPLERKKPKSFTDATGKISEILRLGSMEIPDQKSFRGTGAPGRLLEYLLGIDENNQDSPDLRDWEVKFHGGSALLTLFHKEPEPRGIIYYFAREKQASIALELSKRLNNGFFMHGAWAQSALKKINQCQRIMNYYANIHETNN